MPLKIAQLGQPVLRAVAQTILPEVIPSAEFQATLDAMQETMLESGGIGLAGPQVFDSRRFFLARIPTSEPRRELEAEVFINPRFLALSNEMRSSWEGCLSFEELMVLVPRHIQVKIEYLDRHGQCKSIELDDFSARVVQHEYDHLEGILTLDRAKSTLDIIKLSEQADVMQARSAISPEPGSEVSVDH